LFRHLNLSLDEKQKPNLLMRNSARRRTWCIRYRSRIFRLSEEAEDIMYVRPAAGKRTNRIFSTSTDALPAARALIRAAENVCDVPVTSAAIVVPVPPLSVTERRTESLAVAPVH
jgi:hypothetical protein